MHQNQPQPKKQPAKATPTTTTAAAAAAALTALTIMARTSKHKCADLNNNNSKAVRQIHHGPSCP